MARQFGRVLVLVWAMLLGACGSTVVVQTQGSSSTPAPDGTMPFISEPGGPSSLKLLPVRIESMPADSGWKQYTVTVAVENAGQGLIALRTVSDSGTVQTQEGFTYNVTPYDFGGSPEISLPPGFRAMGSSFTFKAAETAHITQAKFEKFGVVDLTTVVKPTFPADTLPSPLHKLSDGIQTADTKITFKKLRQDTLTLMDIQMQNLNMGYENSNATPSCAAIDSQGTAYNLDINEAVTVGPGKTVEKTFPFVKLKIPDGELSKTVMLCYNNYDLKSGKGAVELFSLQ